VALGAAGVWLLGLAHGFKGVYCFNSTHTCTSQDIEFQGHVVVWLAPIVFVACLLLLRAIKRFRMQRYANQIAAHQQLAQRATQPTASPVSDGSDANPKPRHAAPEPE